MRLESFQIKNCFGFIDSGRVNLKDTNNFVYILGRNSSGKSSFLNALRYFESNIVLEQQPNFHNFNPSQEESRLIAEFNIDKGDISASKLVDKFRKILRERLQKSGIPVEVIESNAKLKTLIKTIQSIYEELIERFIKNNYVRVEKFADGHYRFLTDESYTDFTSRFKQIDNTVTAATGPGNPVNVGGTNREIGSISFAEIEDSLFLQFPRVFLFNEQYSLKEDLPDRITNDWFRLGNKSELQKAFVSFLGEDTVKKFLITNDPDELEHLKVQMQEKLNQLTLKVNRYSDNNGNSRDLLELRLHEKNGLQITVQTDGKKSFYTHLSENTKFLFAYYLYQEVNDIQGDILLFDEPNRGFHATAQEFILNFLKSVSNKNLVIISTHSEHLIDPDLLSGVRIMSIDKNKNMIVKNHFYNQAKEKGDYLALQPIRDAIGLKYTRLVTIHDKVIITEGITDMLYLKAFNTILSHEGELNIAPARSASHILSLIPLLISQELSFKIIIDKGDIKEQIQQSYSIGDEFIWEVPVPVEFVDKMNTSGIEDLFTKNDFKKLLAQPVGEEFNHVSNSFYVRNTSFKRLIAHKFYEHAKTYQPVQFEDKTIANFRQILDFCKTDKWFTF